MSHLKSLRNLNSNWTQAHCWQAVFRTQKMVSLKLMRCDHHNWCCTKCIPPTLAVLLVSKNYPYLATLRRTLPQHRKILPVLSAAAINAAVHPATRHVLIPMTFLFLCVSQRSCWRALGLTPLWFIVKGDVDIAADKHVGQSQYCIMARPVIGRAVRSAGFFRGGFSGGRRRAGVTPHVGRCLLEKQRRWTAHVK